MKIAILSEVYPSERTPDAHAFVHARSVLYRQAGCQVQVFSQALPGMDGCESFESVPVLRVHPERLEREIEAFRPHVIALHAPYAGTPAFNVAGELAGSYPVVAWVHGYEAMYTAFHGYHHGWRRLASLPWDVAKLWRLRLFLRRCVGVVYVARWMRQVAERGMAYRHPNTHVIHNPVDTQRFTPRPDSRPRHRERPLRGIALRGLGRKYGLDIAIRAYAGISGTDLTIIGTGPLEGELRALIATTRSRTTLKVEAYPHARVPELLQDYDYFVAPSRAESQGVAMCEAMACGLPVVATCVGGIPEFVRDGVDGYLVPSEDPPALQAAVRRLVASPEMLGEMAANARERIEQVAGGTVIAEKELAMLAAAAQQKERTVQA